MNGGKVKAAAFSGWGGGAKSDHGTKIKHTYMTNFACLFTCSILYRNTAYFGGAKLCIHPYFLLLGGGGAPPPGSTTLGKSTA